MTPILTRTPRKTSPRVEKVSVTLRIPTELKAWADEFALHSHIDLSGLFIQSLRETQQRGVLRIAPLGYRNDVVSESDFSPESWKNLYNSIAELESKESHAEIILQDWSEYRELKIQEISTTR